MLPESEFVVEIEELVEQMFVGLDEMREAEVGSHVQRLLIDRIFRHVHSVKGLAATAGLGHLQHIAHAFEDLLHAARNETIAIDDEILDLVEAAANGLNERLNTPATEHHGVAHAELIDKLQSAARKHRVAQSLINEAILEFIPSHFRDDLKEPDKRRLIRSIERGANLLVVSANFDISKVDQEFPPLKQKLSEWGEVFSTSAAANDKLPAEINFRMLYATELPATKLKELFPNVAGLAFEQILAGVKLPVPKINQPYRDIPDTSVGSPASVVRIDLAKLDRLISSTHDLFRSTTNALDVALSSRELSAAAREELSRLEAGIRTEFLEVESEIINLRMVPLGPTLQRAARAGRAAARQSMKEVGFEVAGGGLQIDKLLAEAISDPLIQLVRNAVDHGIESPEEREPKNKRGVVRIEASHEGNQTRVRVTDDGRGIDPRAVTQAARRLGIAHEDLDLERSLRLIFRPGFTTLESTSELSGRGVGLDVVETSVEKVGGALHVSSKPASGSSFEIRLPVTFGLLTAMVVTSGGNRYCIAANQVLSTSNAREESPPESDVTETSLRELLDQGAPKTFAGELPVVTCRLQADGKGANANSQKDVRIVVDEVIGTEEVLVRNLGRHAGRWYGIAGATELRDGSLALVLDLPTLVT